ncbi:hypothetical protein BCR37DRAFT_406672 [Protomyces lactucae-debilis]|uniref:Uncharacterized protein n=1 Tax=Protomyces lactucae-debilis TaxID=2754530 RepID=A0A1Y2EV21_PROLT|nr:uncharacterized protein BCR37DRAFT_406672 [Protomyces lactucae-debilis]ORY75114.1 hypothetical protein BCR37DRAFT_406672 [Protomyces lactucae-debilis]
MLQSAISGALLLASLTWLAYLEVLECERGTFRMVKAITLRNNATDCLSICESNVQQHLDVLKRQLPDPCLALTKPLHGDFDWLYTNSTAEQMKLAGDSTSFSVTACMCSVDLTINRKYRTDLFSKRPKRKSSPFNTPTSVSSLDCTFAAMSKRLAIFGWKVDPDEIEWRYRFKGMIRETLSCKTWTTLDRPSIKSPFWVLKYDLTKTQLQKIDAYLSKPEKPPLPWQ